MPRHYRDFHLQWRRGPQAHIHSRPPTARFEKDEWGRSTLCRLPGYTWSIQRHPTSTP